MAPSGANPTEADMVATGSRSPRVTNVLTAECFDSLHILGALNLQKDSSKKKAIDKLTSALARGFEGWAMPIPELPGMVPAMTVDFRSLRLIPISSIGTSGEDYSRVASVDSPFRELVAWAYMQSTGRPGLPERNFPEWASAITDLMGNDER